MKYIYGLFIDAYVYVGSTKDLTMRYYQHVIALRSGRHYNRYLQMIYHGKSKMRLLEQTDEMPSQGREQFWINRLSMEGWKIVNINRAALSTQTSRKKRIRQVFTPLLVTRKKRKNSP